MISRELTLPIQLYSWVWVYIFFDVRYRQVRVKDTLHIYTLETALNYCKNFMTMAGSVLND